MNPFRAIFLAAAACWRWRSSPSTPRSIQCASRCRTASSICRPMSLSIDNLIQKHAAAAGLGDIKVTLRNMASGPVTSDLILANDADIGMGGWGPAFIMWDKTSGRQ